MTLHADLDPFTRGAPDVHLQPLRHPPRDLFERVYAAVIAGGEGLDIDDLRVRLGRFRSNIAPLPKELRSDR